jgi:large subunit ribosomal protein L10
MDPSGPHTEDGDCRTRAVLPPTLVVPLFRTGEPEGGADRRGFPWVNPACQVMPGRSRRRRELDRTEKREFVASLAAVFAETSMVVVTRNDGLTVADATILRQRVRAAGATYKVAKNRLANLALAGTRFEGISPLLKGPTALSWSADPVAVAKVLVEFAKTNEKLVLLGGALGTQTLNVDGVKALAELPSLDTLRAQLVGMISTPATRIAGVLQAPAGQLARVFGAYAKKDEAA